MGKNKVININSEKRILGIVVGLIFIIIVILAVLISLNEKTLSRGKTQYAGDLAVPSPGQGGQVTTVVPQEQGTPTTKVPASDGMSTYRNRDTTRPQTPVIGTASSEGRQVVILSPFQVQESFERARAIVYGSQCYAMLGDVREVSYLTGLVGQKFIANMMPSEDYSIFTVVVAVKLMDARKIPVFYQEYPVTVDLTKNKIMECKGRPITLDDLYAY